LKLFEASISEKQKEVEDIRKELLEARLANERERDRNFELQDDLKAITVKYREEQETRAELTRVLESLKRRLGSSE
jgi:septal ring factor EnvC (AmiA/AmiB activator)